MKMKENSPLKIACPQKGKSNAIIAQLDDFDEDDVKNY